MSQLPGYTANAPVAPYGNANAVNLGRLITPQQLGYPNAQSLAAAQGTANPFYGSPTGLANMSYDIYHNPVQMNTAAPVVPGHPGTFGAVTRSQQATGQGPAVAAGMALHYVPYPDEPLPIPGTPL
jgi:hypothetical protein